MTAGEEVREVAEKESLSQFEKLKEAINESFPEGEVEINWDSGVQVHIEKCVER